MIVIIAKHSKCHSAHVASIVLVGPGVTHVY